mgnify:CR=1 FL=1|nr:MAG TPA: PD-(D/E)XK nuclease superfamily protein [Caudoviricetes sp.]
MSMQTTSTKPQKHSQRAHALLSASGASRWLNCTPSAKLEDEYGDKSTSSYAAEGTLAHELAELYLRKDVLENISDADFERSLEEIMANKLFNDEMLEVVPTYTDYCEDQYVEAKKNNDYAIIEIEQKLDLTEYVPESFGTADTVIISDGLMEVIDLKYGKGIPVYADWNKQLMLYALGALRKYDTMYDINEVRVTICQPRINNISSWQISVEELLRWAEEELRPTADMAFRGEGELNAGDWCRFCAVRNQCKKLYEQQFEIAKHEFAEPQLLTDEEIADIVQRTPKLVEWANSIAEYAKKKAIEENKQWPGLKLVEGRSRRKWIDEDKALETIFEQFPELDEADVTTTKINGITAIEKLVGKKKFFEKLKDVVVTPQGNPTLVPLEDKRPAIGYAQAQLDFKDE